MQKGTALMSVRPSDHKPPEKAPPAQSSLENFDRLMRGLVHVSKAELDAELAKDKDTKKLRNAKKK